MAPSAECQRVRESLGIAKVDVFSDEDVEPMFRLTRHDDLYGRWACSVLVAGGLLVRGFQVEFSDLLNSIAILPMRARGTGEVCSLSGTVAVSPIDPSIAERLRDGSSSIAGAIGTPTAMGFETMFCAPSGDLDDLWAISPSRLSINPLQGFPPSAWSRITRPIVDLVKALLSKADVSRD